MGIEKATDAESTVKTRCSSRDLTLLWQANRILKK